MNQLEKFHDDVIKFFEESPYHPKSGGFLGRTNGVIDRCCPVAVESVKQGFMRDDYIEAVGQKYGFGREDIWNIVYGVDAIKPHSNCESDPFWLMGRRLRKELGLDK